MTKNYLCQLNKKIIVKERGKIHQISVNEIEYIYTESGITSIFKINNDKIVVSKNMSYFENELIDLEFVRVNRNEMVNCAFISKCDIKSRQVTINNTKIIKISCRNMKKIIKKFKKMNITECN